MKPTARFFGSSIVYITLIDNPFSWSTPAFVYDARINVSLSCVGDAKKLSKMSKLLVVDDDAQLRKGLVLFLRKRGFSVLEAGDLAEANQLQASESPDLLIVDYQLPDGTAFDLLEAARARDLGAAMIVLTGLGTIDLAIRAIKAGAEHFLTKPVDLESLDVVVCRTLDAQRERRQRAVAAAARSGVDPFLGTGKKIKELRELASAVLASDVPVLIQGETGTGKTLLARWLHDHGTRRDEPFIDLNCAGLSPEHAESELFGHQRDAFNGASANKPGLFEVAHGGTLFLDEIGDLQLAVQPKLGKALEEGRFRRIGEVATRSADFRLMTATHRDLPALAKAHTFRDDLLFRINAVTLEIPPLRQRRQDIAVLANALLLELTRRVGRSCPVVTKDAVEVLSQYGWPGNVRELRNVLERALLFCKTDVLDRDGLRFDRSLEPDTRREEELTLDDAERRHLVLVLTKAGGSVEDAAKLLKLSRSSLYAKLKKYGIKNSAS